MLKLISIEPSGRQNKKYMALFSDGKTVHFGAKGYDDFISTPGDIKKRESYLKRHAPRENWGDPQTPGALSRWILWEYPNLQISIREFKRRFNL